MRTRDVTRRRRRPLRLLIRGQAAGAVLALFALGVFAVYAASPVVEVYDSRLVVYTGDSLMRQGNVGLDEYGPIVHGWPCYRARGRVLSRFPQGTAVFTVPFLAVAEAGARAFGHDPVRSLRSRF